MTHPPCSLYTIGPPLPHCDCHVTLDSVYISEVHSLYSLVLISQDFLFSCLPLCDTSSWISLNLTSLVPSALSLSYLSLSGPSHRSCQDVCKPSHFHQTLTRPSDTVSQPLVPSVLIRATLVACVVVCVHLSQYSVLVARQLALTHLLLFLLFPCFITYPPAYLSFALHPCCFPLSPV
jgi:hypothetical protein